MRATREAYEVTRKAFYAYAGGDAERAKVEERDYLTEAAPPYRYLVLEARARPPELPDLVLGVLAVALLTGATMTVTFFDRGRAYASLTASRELDADEIAAARAAVPLDAKPIEREAERFVSREVSI